MARKIARKALGRFSATTAAIGIVIFTRTYLFKCRRIVLHFFTLHKSPGLLLIIVYIFIRFKSTQHDFEDGDECSWVNTVAGIPFKTIGPSNATCKPFTLPLCGQAFGRFCTFLKSKTCECMTHPDCSANITKMWAIVKDDKGMLNELKNFSWKVHCNFSEIFDLADSEYIEVNQRTIHGDNRGNFFQMNYTDLLKVSCFNAETEENWWFIFLVPRKNPTTDHFPKVHQMRSSLRSHQRELPLLNIMIWMNDGISTDWMRRTMPKSMAYVKEKMGGILLEGFTQLGRNSLPNIIPFWTGMDHISWLQPAVNRTRFVEDLSPTLMAEYRKAGYVTAYYEDSHIGVGYDTVYNAPWVGDERSKLKRFRNPPADYFSWPFMTKGWEVDKANLPMCFGTIGSNMHAMNYLKRTWQHHRDQRKFFFFAQGTYSHHGLVDTKMIDGEFKHFMQTWVNTPEVRNNTLLIIMSDHGNHMFQGGNGSVEFYLDRRMPLASLILPPWMDTKFPEHMRHLRENAQHRLVTFYDLRATLEHLLHGEQKEESKGISLFEPHPKNKTCKSAGVPPAYCSCLTNVELPVPKDNFNNDAIWQVAQLAVKKITLHFKTIRTHFINKKRLTIILRARETKNRFGSEPNNSLTIVENELLAFKERLAEVQELQDLLASCPRKLTVVKVCKVEVWVPPETAEDIQINYDIESLLEDHEGQERDHPYFFAFYIIADPGRMKMKVLVVKEPGHNLHVLPRSFTIVPSDGPNRRESNHYKCMKAMRMYRRMSLIEDASVAYTN